MTRLPTEAHATVFIASIQQALQDSYQEQSLAYEHAWWLLIFITKRSKAQLLAMPTLSLHEEERELLQACINHITVCHEPIQYLIGTVPFLDLTMHLRPPCLIPRPETEYWVDKLIETVRPFCHLPLRILDLCTGSGCIALALARALPQSRVYGVDIDPEAIALAHENGDAHGITNIQWVQADLRDDLTHLGRFDIITANPPYVSEAEWSTMDYSVKEWESKQALVADDDGYALLRTIIQIAPRLLRIPEVPLTGQLWLEYAPHQVTTIRTLLEASHFDNITTCTDQFGRERYLFANKPA